jgi:hypothetical protein
MADLAEFDTFVTQFGRSLTKEAETGDDNWFGRLVRFHQSSEFQLINFFGTNYTESEFRQALEDDTIVVKNFDVSNINYVTDPNNAFFATATADVYISATIDGEPIDGNFTVTHKIKQTWQSYETEITNT